MCACYFAQLLRVFLLLIVDVERILVAVDQLLDVVIPNEGHVDDFPVLLLLLFFFIVHLWSIGVSNERLRLFGAFARILGAARHLFLPL